MLGELGAAGIETTYDAQGNVAGVTYLGLEGLPALNAQGYATEQRTYDALGYCVL